MNWKIRQLWGATWHYLNQPLFTSEMQSVWKPSRFWYLYKIQLLENCWRKDCASQSHYTQ